MEMLSGEESLKADRVMERKIRVLVSKVGLDGHDRGVRVVARGLVDAGMEVVYVGLHRTPEELVDAAVDEDVDALGISIHSAAHMTLFPRLLGLLEKRGVEHILLTGGGIIPEEDAAELESMGVGRIFGPGTPMSDIVEYITAEVRRRRKASARKS
jgi:methylmalonyl-CoA mutase C-terminal domain/subunit